MIIFKLFCHLALLSILILSLSFDTLLAKEFGFYLFLFQLIIMYSYLFEKKAFFLYLTPIMLVILYVNLSFSLGSYAFYHGLVLNRGDYADYLNWEYTDYITIYVLMINTMLFYLDLSFHKTYLAFYSKPIDFNYIAQKKKLKLLQNIAIFFFILFVLISFDISFLGGSGDMSGVPMTISTLILITLTGYIKPKYRIFIYLFILIGFASFSFDSKREAIFFIFPILFLEAFFNKLEINIKLALQMIVISVFLVFLILIMSIMRGYGDFNIEGRNIITVIPFIFDYINHDLFLSNLFNNIETNYTFFHSVQAMEYVMNNENLLSYGSTVIKFLFITIPSSIAEFKPDSIIHLYTYYRSPEYRNIGGSFPINVYAEMFWNFYFFGFLFILIIFTVINLFFLKLLKLIVEKKIFFHIWFLYLYMQILTYARGSGLDMFVVYIVFGFLFSYLYVFIMQLIINKFYLSQLKNYF